MRVIALLAVFNEERFVEGCVDHLLSQGIQTYLIDNESTDATVQAAERAGDGLIGIETFPRAATYSWLPLLARKAELAASLDADWFLHVDADEIRLPPRTGDTLSEALNQVDAHGYNAVDFLEFTFVPTLEEPDHDHPHFHETMHRYYPYRPEFPYRLSAWKRQEQLVDLKTSGGHRVDFPGLRMYPESFPMRHYLFLSVEHAQRKYVERVYDPAEIEAGMHRRRAELRAESITLLRESDLRLHTPDDDLDPSDPWTEHPLFARPLEEAR